MKEVGLQHAHPNLLKKKKSIILHAVLITFAEASAVNPAARPISVDREKRFSRTSGVLAPDRPPPPSPEKQTPSFAPPSSPPTHDWCVLIPGLLEFCSPSSEVFGFNARFIKCYRPDDHMRAKQQLSPKWVQNMQIKTHSPLHPPPPSFFGFHGWLRVSD